jgi:hypothetical protein
MSAGSSSAAVQDGADMARADGMSGSQAAPGSTDAGSMRTDATQEARASSQPSLPPIPDDPVTGRYPLLSHLADQDDASRLQAFSQVLQEMRGELDRLAGSDAPRTDAHQRQGRR